MSLMKTFFNMSGLEGQGGFHSYRRWVTIYQKGLAKSKNYTLVPIVSTNNLRSFLRNSDEVCSFSTTRDMSKATLSVAGDDTTWGGEEGVYCT
jgi:hypothetical protein